MRDRIEIKVCGMRDPHNLEQLCGLEPDYVGYIFYPPSPRHVGEHPDPALFRIPGKGIKKTGVFVDEDAEKVTKAIERYGLEAVQLHGQEPAAYCRRLSALAVEVIKVLDPLDPEAKLERYLDAVDLFLFDSAGEGSGGTGLKFNWDLLGNRVIGKPFILSGGIGPGDGRRIRSLELRGFRGIDINSRFELAPGMKDIESIREFIMEIRK